MVAYMHFTPGDGAPQSLLLIGSHGPPAQHNPASPIPGWVMDLCAKLFVF